VGPDGTPAREFVTGQFLALVAQCLNLGLGRRIGDGQTGDLPVRVVERGSRLIRPGHRPEDLCRKFVTSGRFSR